jgi:hypothetical protein
MAMHGTRPCQGEILDFVQLYEKLSFARIVMNFLYRTLQQRFAFAT